MASDGNQQPNREQLLQMAINSAKSGNRDGARMMLRQVLSEDKRNERAMMWMANIARSKAERRQWLERVLDVNPDHGQAQALVNKMQYRASAQQNRTLLIFGVVVGVLVVLMIVVVVAILLAS
jgi:lipopolysaccharide biosynthesis regulator YciM